MILSERDLERFNSKIMPEPNSGCYLWMGACHPYGTFSVAGYRQRHAHIVSYELVHGPVAPRTHVHHRCENKTCVNVAHLEALTPEVHATLPKRRPKRLGKRVKKSEPLRLVIDAFGSCEAVGKFLGLTKATVSSWTRIPYRHIRALSDELNVDVYTLRPDLL